MVTPRAILASGGSVVTVHGGGFSGTPDFFCRLGGRRTAGLVLSDSVATCLPVPGLSGFLSLEVSTNGFDFTEDGVQLQTTAPAVRSVTPREIPAWAPAVVTLHGEGLHDKQGAGAVPFSSFVSSRMVILEVVPPPRTSAEVEAAVSVGVPVLGANV